MKENKGHKWDQSISSNREANSGHRHKRHSGQDSAQDPDQSCMDESVASGAVKAKKFTPSSGLKTSGGGSGFARKTPESSAVSIDSQRRVNGTVLESTMAVETVDGRVAYEGRQKNQSSSTRIVSPSLRQGNRPLSFRW